MATFIAQLINGLAIGSIYALVVMGYNLLILVSGILQFSFGHLVVMAMYAGWIALGLTNNNLALAIPIAITACLLLNTLTAFIFRPMAARGAYLEAIAVGIGIGIIITDILSHFLNQGRAISFPATLTAGGAMMKFGAITFSLGNIYTLVGCIGSLVALLYFLYRHKQGRALRAVALDIDLACLMGIPINRTTIYSFALAGALGGISAVLLAMSLGSASPALGDRLAIIALALMMFAGMGNLKGGLICGFIVGLVESMTMAFLPGRWTDAIIFGLIMIAIIIRPEGLFGTKATVKF